jgi:tetratricopeptide (TPR) repeat protein
MRSIPSRVDVALWAALLSAGLGLARTPAASAQPAPPAAAAADTDSAPVDPEARRLFEEGLRYFRIGDYEQAIPRFKAAYLRTPAPGLLYNLAQAHRLNGDCAQALALYRQYLATGPKGKDTERAAARAAEMELCARAAAPPESAPAPVAQPPAAPRPADPPDLVRKEEPIPPALPHRQRHVRGALSSGAVAVALLGVASYFGWRATQDARYVSGYYSGMKQWDDSAAQAERDGHREERIAYVTGGGALVAGGLATWLLLRD